MPDAPHLDIGSIVTMENDAEFGSGTLRFVVIGTGYTYTQRGGLLATAGRDAAGAVRCAAPAAATAAARDPGERHHHDSCRAAYRAAGSIGSTVARGSIPRHQAPPDDLGNKQGTLQLLDIASTTWGAIASLNSNLAPQTHTREQVRYRPDFSPTRWRPAAPSGQRRIR